MCLVWIFQMLVEQYKNIIIFLLLILVIYFGGVIRGLYFNNSQLRDKILHRVETLEHNLDVQNLKLEEIKDVAQ